MNSTETSNGYFQHLEDRRDRGSIPEEEPEEPAFALDLRINCASASISIFDDKNVFGQLHSGIQQNEGSRDQETNPFVTNSSKISFPEVKLERQNESDPVHDQGHAIRRRVSPLPVSQLLQFHQPNSMSDQRYPYQSASTNKFFTKAEKMDSEPDVYEFQRHESLKIPFYSSPHQTSPDQERRHYYNQNGARNPCQCSMSGCSHCVRSGEYSLPRAPPPSVAVQRDRSRSPLLSPRGRTEDFRSRMSNHSFMSPETDEQFSHSPSDSRDESRFGGYIHKRFNARSIFLSRVIQRQQDYYNNESENQPRFTANILPPDVADIDRRLRNVGQEYPGLFQRLSVHRDGIVQQQRDFHPLPRQSHQVSPPEVIDIDHKLRSIEQSLTCRSDLVSRMEMNESKVPGLADHIRLHGRQVPYFHNKSENENHVDKLNHRMDTGNPAESFRFRISKHGNSREIHREYSQFQQPRRSPSPIRAQSTLPLNLSKEDNIGLQHQSKMFPPFSSGRDSPPRRRENPASWNTSYSMLTDSHKKARTPSPMFKQPTKINEEKMKDFSQETAAKSRRGRPRKHVRKIPLPPLYVFIRNLLHNQSYNPKIVSWVNESQGIFKVNHTIEFAKTWGLMKSHRSEEMNYEKMSRAMRYHYGGPGRKGHLAMVKEKRLVYKFGELAIHWRSGEVPMVKCDLHELCKGCLCLWTKE